MFPHFIKINKFMIARKFLRNITVVTNLANRLWMRKIFHFSFIKPIPKVLWLANVLPISVAYMEKESKLKIIPNLQNVITKADELYMDNEVDQLYQYLSQFKDCNEAEILWRIARAFCDKSKQVADVEDKKKLIYEAFAFAETSLKIGEDNFACHKWYAILLDYVGEYQGMKERLMKAFEIKEHFQRAIELNNKDATSVHLLGYWCFVFANLSWYQRKLASVLFTTPPSSSYREALKYFLKAEEIEEGFYSMNLLMIGKTYLALKEKELAKKYFLKTVACDSKTEDDKKAVIEATKLLKSL